MERHLVHPGHRGVRAAAHGTVLLPVLGKGVGKPKNFLTVGETAVFEGCGVLKE